MRPWQQSLATVERGDWRFCFGLLTGGVRSTLLEFHLTVDNVLARIGEVPLGLPVTDFAGGHIWRFFDIPIGGRRNPVESPLDLSTIESRGRGREVRCNGNELGEPCHRDAVWGIHAEKSNRPNCD